MVLSTEFEAHDEAESETGLTGRPRGTTEVDSDIRKLREMIRSQVRMYLQMQRAIWQIVRPGRKELTDVQLMKLRSGIELLVRDDLRGQLQEITDFLSRITKNAIDVERAQDKAIGSMDDAQLQSQIRAEFIRAAHTFGDDEWALLDEVRKLQQTAGARAASMVTRYPTQKIQREAE